MTISQRLLAVEEGPFVVNIGAKSSTTSVASIAFTVPAGGIPKGAVICVAATDYNATPGTVTDTGGNTYAKTALGLNNLSGNGSFGVSWALVTTALAAGNTITYTMSPASTAAVTFFYILGLTAASPNDAAVTATGFGSSLGASFNSGVPSTGPEFFVAAAGILPAGTGCTYTQDTTDGWATTFTSILDTKNTRALVAGGTLLNPATALKAYKPTFSINAPWAAVILGFKKA